MSKLNDIISFTKFLNHFRMVKRTIYLPWEDRMENDAEHSFQLAMLAWYIVNSYSIPLDIDKIIKFALVHDLVETYAWDVFFYTSNLNELKQKSDKEKQAAKLIKENFPSFLELHKLISEYELNNSEEAKFVYSLDKLLPIINTYLDNGRTWKEFDISLDVLLELKDKKISVSPYVYDIWLDFVKLINKNKEWLFKSL